MRRIRCSEVLGGATLNIIDHRSSAINHRPSGAGEGPQVVVTGGMAQAVCACSAACHHASSFKLPASAALGPRASRPIPAGACAGLRTCCWMEQSAGGGGARSSLAAPPDGRQPAGACPACPRVTHGWCGPRARSCRGETRVCVFQVGMIPSVVAEAGCPRRGPAGAASRTARGAGGGDGHHPCRRQHRGQCQWAAGSCLEGFVGACQASTMRRSGASPEPAANAGAHRVSETCPDARGAVQAGRGGMPLTHADASMHASGLQPQASAARPHCAQPALARLTLSGEPAGAPGR